MGSTGFRAVWAHIRIGWRILKTATMKTPPITPIPAMATTGIPQARSNFLAETICAIDAAGFEPADITFIGAVGTAPNPHTGCYCSWAQFEANSITFGR